VSFDRLLDNLGFLNQKFRQILFSQPAAMRTDSSAPALSLKQVNAILLDEFLDLAFLSPR